MNSSLEAFDAFLLPTPEVLKSIRLRLEVTTKESFQKAASAATSASAWFAVGTRDAKTFSMLKNFYAFQVAKEFYWECKLLILPGYLKDQLLRASSSIALNLSEGSGKRTPADQRRFYANAYGSLRESQAILELERIIDPQVLRLADQLGAMLFTLSRKKLPTENQTDADVSADAERPLK